MLKRHCVLPVSILLATAVAAAQAPSPSVDRGELDVRISAGLISLRAKAAPLSTVLERIADVTGMKLSFTDARPKDPVTLELRDVTPRQAITQILEGLGADYAVGFSADQSRIETLVVTGAGLRGSARPAVPPDRGESARGEPATRAAPSLAVGDDELEPPRPPGVELPNEAHPPLPQRPPDLPTSPFVPYYGSLNPDGPPPDPNEPLIEFPSPGDAVDMDGMGPDGTPTTERKGRLPEVVPAPLPASPNPPPAPPALPPSPTPERP